MGVAFGPTCGLQGNTEILSKQGQKYLLVVIYRLAIFEDNNHLASIKVNQQHFNNLPTAKLCSVQLLSKMDKIKFLQILLYIMMEILSENNLI